MTRNLLAVALQTMSVCNTTYDGGTMTQHKTAYPYSITTNQRPPVGWRDAALLLLIFSAYELHLLYAPSCGCIDWRATKSRNNRNRIITTRYQQTVPSHHSYSYADGISRFDLAWRKALTCVRMFACATIGLIIKLSAWCDFLDTMYTMEYTNLGHNVLASYAHRGAGSNKSPHTKRILTRGKTLEGKNNTHTSHEPQTQEVCMYNKYLYTVYTKQKQQN